MATGDARPKQNTSACHIVMSKLVKDDSSEAGFMRQVKGTGMRFTYELVIFASIKEVI